LFYRSKLLFKSGLHLQHRYTTDLNSPKSVCESAAPNYTCIRQAVLEMILYKYIYIYRHTHAHARNRWTDTALPLSVHLYTL